MKRLLVVGGLAACIVALAAIEQHQQPPPQEQAQVIKLAPSFASVAAIDVSVSKPMSLAPVVVLASSLRNVQVLKVHRLRPTWRGSVPVALTLYRLKHTSNLSMRGWGFL
jgi:hypothetical protein